MVRKDEMNILIDSKFNEIKNVFVHETKGLFIKEMNDEMKKLFAEEFEKIKTETNKKIFNFSDAFQKHLRNLKHSNEELQKNAKSMNIMVDAYV